MDLFGQRADANAIRGCRPTSTREFDSSCSLQRAVDVAASLLMTTAGHTVVYFVMGQMVGDRRFPGATTLGSRSCTPSANHPVSVPPTGPVHRDGSFFPYIVTGSSVFWDFGSLHLETSRRPTGQLLRQRHTQRKTFRRPRRLLRQRQAQQVRRSGVKELKLVLRMEFLLSIAFRGVLWRLSSGSLHG